MDRVIGEVSLSYSRIFLKMQESIVRGRFAPSPTGRMHVGNARTALLAWLSVRQKNGTFVWRLEDIDTPRVVPGMAEAAAADLQWLGLDWDEGPAKGGNYGSYTQSERLPIYEAALQELNNAGYLFPCSYSRKELQNLASAPHGLGVKTAYPLELRPQNLPVDWFATQQKGLGDAVNIRFKVGPGIRAFTDLVQGRIEQDVQAAVGDFVVKRRDGLFAYQLAVVVDDLAMEISEVVRGEDLLHSTARQLMLIEALGGKPPVYAHVPLIRNAEGEKLSKRDAGLTLRALREAGVRPEQLVGYFAYSLGLINEIIPVTPGALLPYFRWEKIAKKDWVLPADLVAQLTTT